jgi:DNA-directed RNA polymerase subunit RPC12/RpoP
MDTQRKQPNYKCDKCSRDIEQAFNENTNSFQYAETFRKYRTAENKDYYFCNECYEKLQIKLKGIREKTFEGFLK